MRQTSSVDLAPNAFLKAATVPLLGWLAFYDHYWSNRWSSTIGYSEALQKNTAGQLGTAFNAGRYTTANLLSYPVKNVTTGAELMWGERKNRSGAVGEDLRTQLTARYQF